MLKWMLIVCLGGATGSLARYSTGIWLSRYNHTNFPFATFIVNIAGSLLIGFFYALSERYSWFSTEWRLLLVTGFCGGLTTFSTFAYENIKLLQQGNTMLFLLYSIGSFMIALIAVIAGINLVKLF